MKEKKYFSTRKKKIVADAQLVLQSAPKEQFA